MKRGILATSLAVIFVGGTVSLPCVGAETAGTPEKQAASEIQKVIEAQEAAWNRGDLEAFMQGYDRSGKTTFVSGDEVTRGWQTVLDRYKAKYASREKMGTLIFSELEITPLGPEVAVALGRWQLKRPRDNPRGRFTLIFRRTPAGWRIVQDHTSAASP